MAQLDRPQRRDSPRTPTTPTIENLRDGEASRRSSISPRHHDSEEDIHSPRSSHKKSLMTKVREKAMKLKHSLSFKKKHNDHDDATHSSSVGLEDDDHEETDAEYLGAPMYESELAPERYKEAARQNPRANPVICEKHVLPTTPSKNENATVENPTTPTEIEKLGPEKTLTPVSEPVTKEIGPAYNSVDSNTQGLTNMKNNSNTTSPKKSGQSKLESGIWDKGVSVKDYLLNKFEPAEEDRALSRAISEAMASPRTSSRKTSGGAKETTVANEVREAVTSLLRNQQPESPRSRPAVLTRSNAAPSSFRHMPISTNAHEVEVDENLGRILQTN